MRRQTEYRAARLPRVFAPHDKRLRLEEQAISSLIIDGYNLIGIYHKDLEAQRENLIELLIEYKKRTGHDIAVVFDGWKGGAGIESFAVRGGVRIIYSRLGEKADAVIKRMLTAERREWIVVSSDREIAGHAWATGSIPIGSGKFLPFLDPVRSGVPLGNEDPFSAAEEDEGEGHRSGRGSAWQLSKKEKAMKRALGKLR